MKSRKGLALEVFDTFGTRSVLVYDVIDVDFSAQLAAFVGLFCFRFNCFFFSFSFLGKQDQRSSEKLLCECMPFVLSLPPPPPPHRILFKKKKCVFRADLKVVTVAAFLMCGGSEFQTEGRIVL